MPRVWIGVGARDAQHPPLGILLEPLALRGALPRTLEMLDVVVVLGSEEACR